MVYGFDDNKNKVEVVKKEDFAIISLTNVLLPAGTTGEKDITFPQYGISNIDDWIVEGVEYAAAGGSMWFVPYRVSDGEIYPQIQKNADLNWLVIRTKGGEVDDYIDINITLRKKSL